MQVRGTDGNRCAAIGWIFVAALIGDMEVSRLLFCSLVHQLRLSRRQEPVRGPALCYASAKLKQFARETLQNG